MGKAWPGSMQSDGSVLLNRPIISDAKEYGRMGVDQLKELRRLQKENDRLRRAVSKLTLDKLTLTEPPL
jgi:hypothetical protein